eukprot:257425-Alexandrium_andersonii.AAC.1
MQVLHHIEQGFQHQRAVESCCGRCDVDRHPGCPDLSIVPETWYPSTSLATITAPRIHQQGCNARG